MVCYVPGKHIYEHNQVEEPAQYYRGNPDEFLKTREIKIEMERMIRSERNVKERKGGEVGGHLIINSLFCPEMGKTVHFYFRFLLMRLTFYHCF